MSEDPCWRILLEQALWSKSGGCAKTIIYSISPSYPQHKEREGACGDGSEWLFKSDRSVIGVLAQWYKLEQNHPCFNMHWGWSVIGHWPGNCKWLFATSLYHKDEKAQAHWKIKARPYHYKGIHHSNLQKKTKTKRTNMHATFKQGRHFYTNRADIFMW